jgi:hypothetical protein
MTLRTPRSSFHFNAPGSSLAMTLALLRMTFAAKRLSREDRPRCLFRSDHPILTLVRLTASRLGFFAAIALLLAMPGMACLVPSEEMTAAERDCCRQTAGDCGAMRGMQSHSCCAKTVNPALSNIAVSPARVTVSPSNVLDHIALPQGLDLNNNSLSSVRWRFGTHSPPPIEPPRSATVLRI